MHAFLNICDCRADHADKKGARDGFDNRPQFLDGRRLASSVVDRAVQPEVVKEI